MSFPHTRGPARSLRRRLRELPVLGNALARWRSAIHSKYHRLTFSSSQDYWERRYAAGGDSGQGSYNVLAEFKAEILNDFVAQQQVSGVIEFGCGDGNQLGLAAYPCYIGTDVSPTALSRCCDRFRGDASKSFYLLDPAVTLDHAGLFRADLALSIDVIYHLVEDDVFEAHMRALFDSARRFVIIYASDLVDLRVSAHVRLRRFTPWIEQHRPDWRLIRTVPNRYPWNGNPAESSWADFHIFTRQVPNSPPETETSVEMHKSA